MPRSRFEAGLRCRTHFYPTSFCKLVNETSLVRKPDGRKKGIRLCELLPRLSFNRNLYPFAFFKCYAFHCFTHASFARVSGLAVVWFCVYASDVIHATMGI